MDIQIVDATFQDAHDIGQIQSETWMCAYPNPDFGISKEDVKGKVDEWEEQGDQRVIDHMQKPGAKSWVAKQGDKVIGFIAVLKKDDENSVNALHVLPEYQGQGVGTRLLETALDWLGSSKRISLDVVLYNEKAKSLYKKFGFTQQKETDGIPLNNKKTIPKILMVRD